MKKIKIVALLCVLCAVCFCLTACDPGEYHYDYNDLINDVVRIELINYVNSKQKKFISWVPDYSAQLLPFVLQNMTVLETLNNEDIPAFLERLCDMPLLYKYYAFNSPKNIYIRVVYRNGDFEIISCDYENQTFCSYLGKYDSNGKVIEFIGSFASFYDFEDLVNNFFQTQIS